MSQADEYIQEALELAEDNAGDRCPLSSDACGAYFEQIRDLLRKVSENAGQNVSQADSEEMHTALEQIAALAHHGGLIGFSDVDKCLREVRRISLKWWDKSECARLQEEIDAVPPGFSDSSHFPIDPQ